MAPNLIAGAERRGTQQSRVLSRVAFGFARVLLGRRFLDALDALERAQWMDATELQARTETRLARLLKHAAENVPFYGEVCRRLGLTPDDLKTLRELRALPVVTKEMHREHAPDYFLAANLPIWRRLRARTSGSTGQPFEFYLDRAALPLLMANHVFSDAWYGLLPFTRSARFLGPRLPAQPFEPGTSRRIRVRSRISRGIQVLYEGWTQERISTWQVGAEWAESIYRRIEAFRPVFITGYTSAIASVGDELLRRGLRLSFPVRGVITEAEPLTPPRRRLIEEYYGAPIGNRYGPREFGSYTAQSCPESPDQFHVLTEMVVWETVREDGTPAAPGETGRVLLTDLHNYVMPFIRYDTGDLAVAGDSPCACGRGLPLIQQIEGRSHECLQTPSGHVISPAALGHFLFVYRDYLGAVWHYQLVQDAPAQVRLLVVPGPGFDGATRARLRDDLSEMLHHQMAVAVEVVREIPCEASGKRPIIKPLAATAAPGAGGVAGAA